MACETTCTRPAADHNWNGRGVIAVAAAVAGLFALAVEASADTAAKGKPKPASGVDPGGVMVAFVGSGLDYTRGAIAQRMARDGEGEIIGFDLVDRDRRPHCAAPCTAETDAAESMLANAPQARLAVFKVDGPALAAPAMQMAVQAKADVLVVTLPDGPKTGALLRAAAERFKDALIIYAPKRETAATEEVTTPIRQPANAGTGRDEKTGSKAEAATPASPPSEPKAALPETVVAVEATPGATPAEDLQKAASLAAKAAQLIAQSPSTRGAGLRAALEKSAP